MPDIFVNILNIDLFNSTNSAWNDLHLNHPWSIGRVVDLIDGPFQKKEEWEQSYFESGKQREFKLCSLSLSERETLNDYELDKKTVYLVPENLRLLNFKFGRTFKQLSKIGETLYRYMEVQGSRLTVEECIECVRFRTVCETWNGIKIREEGAVCSLSKTFTMVTFEKTSGEVDFDFGVDYLIFQSGKPLCGIQIKPESYASVDASDYVVKARKANIRKHQNYFSKFGLKVFDVIAKQNGQICNIFDLISKIKSVGLVY